MTSVGESVASEIVPTPTPSHKTTTHMVSLPIYIYNLFTHIYILCYNITNHSSALYIGMAKVLYIGMAKVLPIIDVLGIIYDERYDRTMGYNNYFGHVIEGHINGSVLAFAAAHVEAIEQRDSNHSSLLDMVILDCWELRAAPNSVCPGENRTLSSVPICPDCTLDFQSGKEYLLAGRHVPGSQPGSGLYLPNYRKGGLLAVWKRSYSSVGEWVSAAANQTTVH